MNTMNSRRSGTWTHAKSGTSGEAFRSSDGSLAMRQRIGWSTWASVALAEQSGYTLTWDEPHPAQLEKDDATRHVLCDALWGCRQGIVGRSAWDRVIDAVNTLRAKSSVPPTDADVQSGRTPQPSPGAVHVAVQLTDDDREAFKRLWNRMMSPSQVDGWPEWRDGLNAILQERAAELGAVPMVPAPDAEAMAVARLTIKAAKDIGIVRQERDAAIKERDELKRQLDTIETFANDSDAVDQTTTPGDNVVQRVVNLAQRLRNECNKAKAELEALKSAEPAPLDMDAFAQRCYERHKRWHSGHDTDNDLRAACREIVNDTIAIARAVMQEGK